MKWFIIFILTFSINAEECLPELKDSLIEQILKIENGIAKIVSEECTDANRSNKLACSYEEAKQNYNKTLAKLVIVKGIKSLKSDVEMTFESLKNSSLKDIKKSLKVLNQFSKSQKKASLFSKSLNEDFLKKALNSESDDILDDRCKQSKSDLCLEYKSIKEKKEYADLINGFVRAYKELDPDLRSIDKNIKSLKDKLTVNINDQLTSLDKIDQTSLNKDVMALSKSLKNLSIAKDENTIKEVYSHLQKIKGYKLSFKSDTSISDEIDEGIREVIQSSISDVTNAYTVLTYEQQVKENLNNALKLILSHQTKSYDGLERDIQSKHLDTCQNLSIGNCIDELKKQGNPAAQLLITRRRSIIKEDKYASLLKSSQSCIDDNKVSFEKGKCLDNLIQNTQSIDIDNDIMTLTKELKQHEEALSNFANNENIKALEEQKVIALSELANNSCIEDSNISINCNKLDVSSYNKAGIDLGIDYGHISIHFNLERLKSLMVEKKDIPKDPQKNTQLKEVTPKLTEKDKKAQRIENKKKRYIARYEKSKARQKKKMLRQKNKNRNESSNAFFNSFSNSMVQATPQIMYQANQRAALNREAQRRREYYNWYKNNLNSHYANYNNFQMNWGNNFYNDYYSNNFNYNNPYLFGGSYYTQYTYGSANIGNISNYGSTSSSTNSGNGFSFSF